MGHAEPAPRKPQNTPLPLVAWPASYSLRWSGRRSGSRRKLLNVHMLHRQGDNIAQVLDNAQVARVKVRKTTQHNHAPQVFLREQRYAKQRHIILAQQFLSHAASKDAPA